MISQRLGAMALTLLLFAVVGAGKRPTPRPPDAAQDIGLTAGQGYFTQPDPKSPGKLLWKMWAQGGSGASLKNGFQATLTGVTAVLFQHGAAAARLKAPRAQGDSAHQIVTASGRVRMVSLAQTGTTLDADTVTWYARTNKIVAAGNVIYKDGRSGLTSHVSQMNADTVLKSVSFGKGRATLRPQRT